MQFSSKVSILCVDDDEIDRRNLSRSMQKNRLDNPLFEATNGVIALEMLRGEEPEVSRPRIVLLDLNMPKMNGLEFLTEVRKDPTLSDLIVFVLTTSEADEDILAAYQHNVAGYLNKPTDARALSQAVGDLKGMWERMLYPDPQA